MSVELRQLRLPLARFTLEVDATLDGRVTAIFGASGAGKTSLLEVIAGLRRPSAGVVRIDGVTLTDAGARSFVAPERRAVGYVPQESLPVIARELNLSRAEVHGVVTFYHDYRNHPAGRHVLKLCRAEACQSMGGDAVAERVKALLGIDFHQTTLDGAVTLEPVYCLGLCSCAPAAMLDGEVHGRVDAALAQELVAEACR